MFCASEARGVEVGVEVVADVHARVDEGAAVVVGHDDLEVHVGKVTEEAFLGVVEARAHGGEEVAEVVLDPVHRRGHVRGAEQPLAAQADEVVLVVVREAEHLVRDDVPEVDDEVPLLGHGHGVEVDRDLPVDGPAGALAHEVGGHGSHVRHAVLPVVGVDALLGDGPEHPAVVLGGVRDVLAEGRDDVHLGAERVETVVDVLGHPPEARVGACDVGREEEHPAVGGDPEAVLGLFEHAVEQRLDLGSGDEGCLCLEPRHGVQRTAMATRRPEVATRCRGTCADGGETSRRRRRPGRLGVRASRCVARARRPRAPRAGRGRRPGPRGP